MELVWYLDVMQIEYNRLINVTIKANVDNCIYKRLTINLRIDIALFQFNIHLNMSLTLSLPVRIVACYFPIVDLSNGDYELSSTLKSTMWYLP